MLGTSREFKQIPRRIFSKARNILGKSSSGQSYQRRYRIGSFEFSGLPNPRGNFSPWKGFSSAQDIEVTPYGYLARSGDALLLLESFQPIRDQNYFRVALQFTSFDDPLAPKLRFDCGEGFDVGPKVDIPVRSSGRAECFFSMPENCQRIALQVSETAAIFAIHNFVLQACSGGELAAKEFPVEAQPQDIICFPVIDWHFRFQRPQQILSRFAERGHRVFYISPNFLGLHHQDAVTQLHAENIVGITLPGNPRLNLYKNQVSGNTLERGISALERIFTYYHIVNATTVVHLPFWMPYAERLRDDYGWKIVYDCMDDHSGFENNDSEMLSLEQQTMERSDALILSSQLLYDQFSPRNDTSSLIRNAGDYEHFCIADSSLDSELAKLSKPVIGYYGALAEWFDVEALRLAATTHPEWSFVLIGHVHESKVEDLAALDNVRLLGEKPYDELPALLSDFDVCTIPFRRIPLTEATNPVKLYEYFASGKPVVARRLPEIEPFESVVSLYDTPGEFVALLEKALEDSDADTIAQRKKYAQENTWDARVDDFTEVCSSLDLGKAAVIIVSYHSVELLHECVTSVLTHTRYQNFELIIVDNNSGEPVKSYLEKLAELCPQVKIVINESNRGFAAANNQAIKLASDADFFVLLNNDTVTPPGWLTRLLYHANQPDIGLVGPVTNSTGNEARIDVDYQLTIQMFEFNRCLMHQFKGESFDIAVLAMYCVAFRREVLDKVGLLDENFTIGMFEDDDYAERVRRAGYRVVCAEDVFVHHYGRASFSKLEDEKYREIFEKNKAVYEAKWGEWVPHKYRG